MTTTTDSSGNATAGAAPAALEGNHWIESLRDGTRVLVRPLRLEDRAMEEALIRRLSPEARRFRFLGDFKVPDKAMLDHLMHVNLDRLAVPAARGAVVVFQVRRFCA